MAVGIINDTTLTAIGDAIREKTGETEKILPNNMPDKIRSIETGGNSSPVDILPWGDDYDIKYGSAGLATPNDLSYKPILDAVTFTDTLTSGFTYLYPPANVKNENEDMVYNYDYVNTSGEFSFYATKGPQMPSQMKLEHIIPVNILSNYPTKRINIVTSQAFAERYPYLKEFDYRKCIRFSDGSTPPWSNTYLNQTYKMFYNCYRLEKVILPVLGPGEWNQTFYNCNSLKAVEIYVAPGSNTDLTYLNFSNAFYNLCSCSSIRIAGQDGSIVNKTPNLTINLQNVGYGYNQPLGTSTSYTDSVYSRTEFKKTIDDLFPSEVTAVIQVKSGAGANNADGGMDALTSEEIAVAADKGWTVVIV